MATEVFNRIGEGESYSRNSNYFRKNDNRDYDGPETSDEKVESITKPMPKHKKEFFDNLKEESLSLDTCDQINKDWKRK